MLGSLLVKEEVQFHATAAAANNRVCGVPSVLAGQGLHADPGHGLAVEIEHTVDVGDQHVAQTVGIAGLNLEHTRIVGAGGLDRRV